MTDPIGEETLRVMAGAPAYSRFLYEQCRPFLGRRVLEVGSGLGSLARHLAGLQRLVLTDVHPGHLAALRRSFPPPAEVRDLDIAAPGAAAAPLWGRFDTALCLNVLEHLEDDQAAFANLARLLEPGGRAVVVVPAHPWLFGSLDRGLGHCRRYRQDQLVAGLTRAGLRPVECRFVNPLAVPGWLVASRVLRSRRISAASVRAFEKLSPVVRACGALRLPFGLSLLAAAEKPAHG